NPEGLHEWVSTWDPKLAPLSKKVEADAVRLGLSPDQVWHDYMWSEGPGADIVHQHLEAMPARKATQTSDTLRDALEDHYMSDQGPKMMEEHQAMGENAPHFNDFIQNHPATQALPPRPAPRTEPAPDQPDLFDQLVELAKKATR